MGYRFERYCFDADFELRTFSAENPAFIDATMLSNHDQVRIGSIADGNSEKLKMAANLLFTLPGNPYLYYGEEIGMKGKSPMKISEKHLFGTNARKTKTERIGENQSIIRTPKPHL